MDALSIALAFLTLVTPGVVVLFSIVWLARKRKQSYQQHLADQVAREASKARMRQPGLRAVPKRQANKK